MTDYPTLPAEPIDNSRAWLLAGAPLLLLAVDAGFLYSGYAESTTVAWVVALAVNIALSAWDSHYLRSRGVAVPAMTGAWFIPGYLYQRSKALGIGQAQLVVWIATLAVSIVGTIVLESHFVTLDMSMIKSGIASWAEKSGTGAVNVSCPSRSVYAVHDTFVCTLSDGSSAAQVLVTVVNSNGYVTWEPIGG